MDWYAKISKWHDQGLWSDAMVQMAVTKGVLTQEQADSIISRPEPEIEVPMK